MPPWCTSAPASTSSTVGYSVTDQSATDQSLRVSVDATSLLDRRTGVGAMASALVSGLAARPDVRLSLFAVSWRGRGGLAAVAPPGATIRRLPVPARLARAAWARTDHPTARLLGGRADVVHGPNFVVPPGGGAVEVVTVHDLTAVHHPEMCTPDVLEWPGLLRRALRRGAWVHTVSEFVAAEVRDAFPEAGDRVVAVPNGVPRPPPSPASDASAGHHLVGGTRYVLALGTVEPRKDLPGLVAAFDLLAPADPDLRLVIAGGDGLASEVARRRHRRITPSRPGRARRLRRRRPPLALLRGATVRRLSESLRGVRPGAARGHGGGHPGGGHQGRCHPRGGGRRRPPGRARRSRQPRPRAPAGARRRRAARDPDRRRPRARAAATAGMQRRRASWTSTVGRWPSGSCSRPPGDGPEEVRPGLGVVVEVVHDLGLERHQATRSARLHDVEAVLQVAPVVDGAAVAGGGGDRDLVRAVEQGHPRQVEAHRADPVAGVDGLLHRLGVDRRRPPCGRASRNSNAKQMSVMRSVAT
jgi:hypothetical protein